MRTTLRRVTVATMALCATGVLGISIAIAKPLLSNGMVRGTVTISPLCPVNVCHPPKSYYDGYRVTLVPVGSWGQSYSYRIGRRGDYAGIAQAGSYTINIDPNPWQLPPCPPGAPCAVPVGHANVPAEITVAGGSVTRFDILVDTGIR